MKTKSILITACAMFLSSCAFDSTRNGAFAHTSFRIGTDTEAKSLEGPGVKLALVNENNSKSFNQVASVAKWAIVGSAIKSVSNSVANSVTKTNLAKQTTQQTSIKTAADVQKAQIAADVEKAKIVVP